MELRLINYAKRCGYDVTRISDWTKTLGYDITKDIREMNRDALKHIIITESKTNDLKRTHALASLARCDYALRKAYIAEEPISMSELMRQKSVLRVEQAFLQYLHIDLATCDVKQIWKCEK